MSPNWSKKSGNIEMKETEFYNNSLEKMKSDLCQLDSVQIFEMFFDSSVIEHIVTETKRYATQKNIHNFSINHEDIHKHTVTKWLSQVARERLYWSLDDDLGVPIVQNYMSRNRYLAIKKCLHLADNSNLDTTDKLAKVRQLGNLLNKNFIKWGIFHKNLSIDESMVKYSGGHRKPIRFGFKNSRLPCSSTGYCYNFDTYTGAKNYQTQSNMPLGSKVVLGLLDVAQNPSDHVVFMDNYFTSHNLMLELKKKGI
ncbi:hypothetical protein PPYR_01456 [Photinus pyralis]|uniref:PiggyBac transposable element-derived protein domain-containing protein n=1 Tax=Photinus pyralis TaxID=7054 RepID=A0A5N4B4I8_PHOPY|nr:hypothetical protein PPYR_01456 [Photinus pyralis]